MSAIKVGDPVLLVFGCCGPIIRNMGYPGTVTAVEDGDLSCKACKVFVVGGAGARAYVDFGDGIGRMFPKKWLMKAKPPRKRVAPMSESTETHQDTPHAPPPAQA